MARPHWVMCMVCGGVIYGGPGINPIPRECDCKATRVVPTEERGYVQWDKDAYHQNAIKLAQEAMQEAKDAGLGPDEARLKGERAMESAPIEPEVEYTEEYLDPNATRVAVRQTTIDQAVAHHLNKIYETGSA